MKTKIEIRARAKKLAVSYLKKKIKLDTGPIPHNCIYNYEVPIAGRYESSCISDVALSPRKSVSLVVIQPPKPVRVCTYHTGTNDWNGDIICDHESISQKCRYFTPSTTPEMSFESFRAELEDDAITRVKYPDLAALQWVLGERFHSRLAYPFVFIWGIALKYLLGRWFLPKEKEVSLEKDVWDEPDSKNTRQ